MIDEDTASDEDDYDILEDVHNFIDEESDEESLSEIEAELDEINRKKSRSMRDKIYFTATYPNWSIWSYLYNVYDASILVVSTVNYLLGTFPQFQNYDYSSPIFICEAVCTTLFTMDYILRYTLTRKHKLRWALEFLNMIDLISVLPFYLELSTPLTSDFRAFVVLRILRFFRVFRIFHYTINIKTSQFFVIVRALRKSMVALGLAFLFTTIFTVFWGSAVFFAELTGSQHDSDNVIRYEDGEVSQFQTIPHSMWWSIYTLTGLGYGDIVPKTYWGKIVASIAIINSLLVLFFPVSIIVTHFYIEYKKVAINKEIKRRHHLEENELQGILRKQMSTRSLRHVWFELIACKRDIESFQKQVESFERIQKNIEIYFDQLRESLIKEEEKMDSNLWNIMKSRIDKIDLHNKTGDVV